MFSKVPIHIVTSLDPDWIVQWVLNHGVCREKWVGWGGRVGWDGLVCWAGWRMNHPCVSSSCFCYRFYRKCHREIIVEGVLVQGV